MRQVVETERFERERNGVAPDIERWDQIMRGIIWGLSLAPDKLGKATHRPDIFIHITHDWPGAPALAFYYRFNDVEVVLLSVVRVIETEESEF